ncbi:MAG TPA: BTAD domain-containing putative transcriptional regulator [Actinomycetota bacterium]|nr:BTAD domain-containing putative transcriptional regulator [Actinomycetota bacterium]
MDPPAPADLQFRILGPLEVARGGETLALGGPRQKAVLACLLVHANEVVPIDALADGIWEGRPPDSATGTIRTYVSHLRRVVEAGGDSGQVLLTTPPGYRLRVEPGELDSDEFERLLGQARRAEADGAPDLALGHLNEALRLWRGPALADFAAESFAHAEAARLDGDRLTAVEERIEAQLALGCHGELVAELEQLAADHPLRERLWGQLMLALYRAGRQAEALGVYQQTRAMLAEEMGIDPGPALRRLQRAILQQDPELDWRPSDKLRPPTPRPAAEPVAPPPPETAPAAGPIFVGRERELRDLGQLLGQAADGQGGLVLLGGQAGIGKTRTAEELAALAQGRGLRVLWGRCHEGDGAPPYWPWAEALRSSANGHDPEALLAELGRYANEIAQFVPELRERLPKPPAATPLDPEAARFQLFESVADLLRRAAERQPTLLVLDDLHWADKPSLMLLQFLTRRLHDAPVLVLGAYRDAEVARQHPLNDVLASLSRERVTHRVTLQGLGAGDVARFVEAATGVPPGPLAAAVHAKTEGNPFFVRELVRLLEVEGRLEVAPEELGWSSVPSTVREVVGRARNRLSGEADHLLRHAAVIGREFDADLLTRLLGIPDDQLVEALEEVLASGLVAEDPGQVGGYRFSHDLVREAVYAELSTIRRAAMHRQIGEAVEALFAACLDRHYAALARHFLLAARGGHDLTRAVEYAMRAADQATAALAYEEAIGHCERALRALRQARPEDHATACRLLLRLGDGHWRAGEVARARDTFLEAAALARSLGQPELLARAAIGFKGELFRDWHTTNGVVNQQLVELAEEALAAIGPGDSPLRVRLLGHLAEALCYTTSDERRDALSKEAVEIARRLDDPAVLAHALCSRCLALWSIQHLRERMRLASAVLELGQRLDSWELRLFGYHHLFVARLELGDVAEAEALLDAFEQIADRLRQPIYLWQAKLFRTLQAQLRGAFEQAEGHAMEALELGQRAQDPDALNLFATQIGLIRLEQGRLGEIEPFVHLFVDQDIPDPNWETARGFIAATLGRTDEARREFERIVVGDGLRSLPRNFVWLAHLALLSESAAMLGHVEGAGILYRLILPFADRAVLAADLQCWGSAARYLGILAAARGHLDDAERWLRRALAMNRRMGASPWVGHTLADLAAAQLRRGRPDDLATARRHLDDALAIARALEMPRLIERLQSTARGQPGLTVGT